MVRQTHGKQQFRNSAQRQHVRIGRVDVLNRWNSRSMAALKRRARNLHRNQTFCMRTGATTSNFQREASHRSARGAQQLREATGNEPQQLACLPEGTIYAKREKTHCKSGGYPIRRSESTTACIELRSCAGSRALTWMPSVCQHWNR